MQKLEPVTVARQSGMTLIELTVVLLVLIGLAGMLLPYVGGFAERTHDSANTSSEAELASAIGRFESQYMRYPSNMDSLTGAAGAPINYFIANRMGSTAAVKYGFQPVDITNAGTPALNTPGALICASLRKAGINTLKGMALADLATATPLTSAAFAAAYPNQTFNPTFNYYLTPATTIGLSGACTGYVMEATDDGAIADTLGMSLEQVQAKRNLGHTWVVVGMGTASEAIGKTIQDAPVHFSARGDVNAANAYNRLLVFYETDGNAAAGASTCITPAAAPNCSGTRGGVVSPRNFSTAFRAQLAGTGMPMHSLLGKNYSLGEFYGRMQQ